jgi:hypothetical protein
MTPAPKTPKNSNYYIDRNALIVPMNEQTMKDLVDQIASMVGDTVEEELSNAVTADDFMFTQPVDDPMTMAEATQILSKAGWVFLKSNHHETDENKDYFLFNTPEGKLMELNRAALISEARLLL